MMFEFTDFDISKEILVLRQLIANGKPSTSFSANVSAKRFINILHSSPIPPLVPKKTNKWGKGAYLDC